MRYARDLEDFGVRRYTSSRPHSQPDICDRRKENGGEQSEVPSDFSEVSSGPWGCPDQRMATFRHPSAARNRTGWAGSEQNLSRAL